MSGDPNIPAVLRGAASEPTITKHRRLFERVATVLIGLMIVGTAFYVPLIAAQNRQLRSKVVQADAKDAAARTLERTLLQNIHVSTMEGRRLPDLLARKIRMALGPQLARVDRGFLLVAFTPSMVCQRALNDGLTSLRNSRALEASGLSLYAIVGERSSQGSHDRESALLLRAERRLAFPMSFVPADSLLAAIAPSWGSRFEEEPLYLRLDKDLAIHSAFHADQYRPGLLDAWLETIQ